jgi:hypothetical protein
MRTTIDIPDELFRRTKARAAMEGRKMKDLIADLVERGLEREASPPGGQRRRRGALPYIPKASVGGTIPALTGDQLARIEEEEDIDRYRRSFGR